MTYEPMKHQAEGRRIAFEKPKFLYGFDPGTGKTALGLDIVQTLKQENRPHRSTVVCPKQVIANAWGNDARNMFPDLTVFADPKASAKKIEQAMRRLHRLGQKQKTVSYILATEGSVDGPIDKSLKRKDNESVGVDRAINELRGMLTTGAWKAA